MPLRRPTARPGWSAASALVLVVLVGPFACRDDASAPAEHDAPAAGGDSDAAEAQRRREAIAGLEAWEESERAATDFASVPPWSEAAGADPFRIVARPGGAIGLLRGLGQEMVDGQPQAAGNDRLQLFPS